MRDVNLNIINDKYAGGGQDIFIMEIFGQKYSGTFIDIGCREPINHNNSFMLEENDWTGIAFDIIDYRIEWEYYRKTPFIRADALIYDFLPAFNAFNMLSPIDYLSLDIEGDGDRLVCLKNILRTEFEFKVITIEHDAYRGYDKTEREPQRELLNSLGYILVVSDDACEDWWINPTYILNSQYSKFISNTFSSFELFKSINLDFTKYYN